MHESENYSKWKGIRYKKLYYMIPFNMRKFKANVMMVESISVVAWLPRIWARINCIGAWVNIRSDRINQNFCYSGCIICTYEIHQTAARMNVISWHISYASVKLVFKVISLYSSIKWRICSFSLHIIVIFFLQQSLECCTSCIKLAQL